MPGNIHVIPPAEVLQSWPTPNYVDPVTRPWMPAFALTWQCISTILVVGRFYLRARKQAGSFGLDDLFIFIGWIFSVAFTASAWVGCEHFELNRHTWDVEPSLYVGAALTGWIAQVMFILSSCPTKLSVLLFYRRMIKDTLDRRWLYAIYFALLVTGGYGVAVLLAYCLMCTPLDAYWKSYNFSWKHEYHCIDGNALTITSGFFSVLSDLYAVALPWAILRHYNVGGTRKQKFALNVIFSLGLLVTGAGIARTYYLWAINHTYDTSWTGFNLFTWSMVECQLAIICACAPSLRAFFRHYLRDSLKRTLGSRGSSVSYHPQKESGNGTAGSSEIEIIRKVPRDIEKGCRSSQIGGPTPRLDSVDLGLERLGTEQSKEVRITTPEEYEMYAVERLTRHVKRAESCRVSRAIEVEIPPSSASSKRSSTLF